MFNIKTLAGLLCFMLFAVNACKEADEVVPAANPKLNTAIHKIMKEWYLWNNQLPTVDPNTYKTPQELLDALRNPSIDKWSYIEDEKTFDQFFTGGQFVGHGFGMKLDAAGNVRVSFVYKNSPMDKQGVTRGYKLLQVNGQNVSGLLANNTFSTAFGEDKVGIQTRLQVEDLSGNKREFTIAKEEISMNTVLYRDVKMVGDKKVGYLVFNTFIEKSIAELNEAFTYFQSQGISELVLDLRYNGGGSLDVAQHLAGLIGASKAGNNKFVELAYNPTKQSSNKPYNFLNDSHAIPLNRLFVITTQSSASASEAVINGLRPYMEVVTIGDATHGKPVGMNIWKAEGYAIVPITFKVANANGQAEYFEGIPVDSRVNDDLSVVFGDPTEDCLEQALYYIKSGTFSPMLASGRLSSENSYNQTIELKGFRAEIGAF